MSNSESASPGIGDIVLVPFPFADHSVTKLRPAIILSSLPADAWLVAYITSSNALASEYDITLSPTEVNNLKVKSFVRVNRLTVINTQMISRTLGVTSSTERQAIAEKLSLLSTKFIDS